MIVDCDVKKQILQKKSESLYISRDMEVRQSINTQNTSISNK